MILFYSYLALGAFVMSLVGTRLVIVNLRRRQALMDVPGPRSNHSKPTPRGGGIAVVFAMVTFLLLANASYWLIIGILLLAAISLVDDWIRLSPLTRICVQLIAVLAGLQDVHLAPFADMLPGWMLQALIVIGWLWFINLFNFMDGIDGISAVEMIGISAGLIMVSLLLGSFSDPVSLHSLVLFGAGFGFLWWNWHPAKIFLGDVGSIPIGYVLGHLLLMGLSEGYYYAVLILPAYYLMDATITLFTRAAGREKIWEAHSQHFYQKAVRGGRKHDVVSIVIAGVNMLLIMLACLAELNREVGWIYLSIAYGMVGAVLFFYMSHPAKTKKLRA